jgi:hypothetical protein
LQQLPNISKIDPTSKISEEATGSSIMGNWAIAQQQSKEKSTFYGASTGA